MIRRNTASQCLYFPALLLTADGTAVTSGATLTVSKDGTEAASAGTLTHSTSGVWKYIPTQGETNCAILALILIATSATPVVLNLVTTGADTSATALGAVTTAAPTAAANAAAVRADQAVELARLDVAVGTRLATSGYTAPPSIAALATSSALTLVQVDTTAIKAKTDNLPTSPAAVGSAMTLTAPYDSAKTAAPTAAANAAAVRADQAVELARLDVAVGTRLATAGYTDPPSIAALATSSALALVQVDTTAIKAQTDQLGFTGTYVRSIVRDITQTALAKFATDNTGETVAAAGSVANLSQGGSSGGMTQGDIDAIVAGVGDGLSSPTFVATVAISTGNTYCTVGDVESRLSAYGVDWLVDVVTPDGVRQTAETALVSQAIDYCNTIIDTYIQGFVRDVSARPTGNAWLRDRCIDLACARVFTLGGRDTPLVLQSSADKAMDWLQRAQNRDIQIPAFPYRSQVLPVTNRKTGTPTVVRF